MEIYKHDFFKVFESNFRYSIVDTTLGTAVEMPAFHAFIYSCITGAGYFDNPTYQFTPKGLMKLFYNAFDYKFVTGIFDNVFLKNTPFILSIAKPYLFAGNKFIIPVEFNSEEDLVSELKNKFEKTNTPTDFIIQRIESSKKGNGMEPFMEYLAAEHFKGKGYVVETQIPLTHSLGSPDFGGYSLDMYQLQNNVLGFHMIELAMLRLQSKIPLLRVSTIASPLIVGEAKTGTNEMSKQLGKYLNSGLFDKGYEIHPHKKSPARTVFGLVTLDENYNLTVTNPQESYSAPNPPSQEEYIAWLNNYIKFYLIANLSNDELTLFYNQKEGKAISGQKDIVRFVTSQSFDDIIGYLKTL